MRPVKGFLFDLDGVITETSHFHFIAWQKLANSIGISFNKNDNEQLKGISRLESLEIILQLDNKANVYSKEEKLVLATSKNDYYLSLIETITPDDLLPNIKDLIEKAKKDGLLIGLTSASKNGPFVLRKLGIDNLFDTVVNPEDLKNGKPDPEIFIKGASQLGLNIEECIGFEDAESGIAAINSAGMFSVGIGEPKTLSAADFLVSSTSELNYEQILKSFQADTNL